MLVGVLIAVLVVLTGGGLLSWHRRAAASGRRTEGSLGDKQRAFYGGVMTRGVTTSGSLVRLDFFTEGIRLHGTIWSRWIVPLWEARYDELAIGELVATPYSRIAVWFRLRDGGGGIGFLSSYGEEILRQLEKHGVPVNRSVQRIKRAADLDAPS